MYVASVSALMPKVSKQDKIVAGSKVPAGICVAWDANSCPRNKSVFGPDPDMFWPQRWVNSNLEKAKVIEQSFDLVFGPGKRGCLGRHNAMMQLNRTPVEVGPYMNYCIIYTY